MKTSIIAGYWFKACNHELFGPNGLTYAYGQPSKSGRATAGTPRVPVFSFEAKLDGAGHGGDVRSDEALFAARDTLDRLELLLAQLD